ncbi:atrial natriuretic peptide-converting enzyme [Lates japonicus]|uniref:Atrial natriuretic peptide-converting enzyme n=1 Tax=Lates japonicus TaxID=270547 RepID=A0AAD3NE42_LATJO|nr:atrial natriuretic peptide-converting enzyme [Lates japonicus]
MGRLAKRPRPTGTGSVASAQRWRLPPQGRKRILGGGCPSEAWPVAVLTASGQARTRSLDCVLARRVGSDNAPAGVLIRAAGCAPSSYTAFTTQALVDLPIYQRGAKLDSGVEEAAVKSNPVCLPQPDQLPSPDSYCYITGWGHMGNRGD